MAFVIAEFCQNHNGDKRLLRDMIWAAAESGADYAKIQTIFADDLTYRERFEEGVIEDGITKVIKRPYRPEFERLRKLEIPCDEYEWFIEECGKAGIRPLTTVFSRTRVQEIAKYGWREVKVPSYDCASYPMLRELKSHFRHLFVSTGAMYDHEIEEAALVLNDVSFAFLHCVTIYPTPLDQLHLARMEYLREFTPSVGFSDHTLVAQDGIKAAAVALHLGADVVERHFTLLAPDQTKDGPVSINLEQLKNICKLTHGTAEERASYVAEHIGDYSQMIGQKQRELSHTELLNRDYYRGRFASHRLDDSIIYNWEDVPLE
jgi:N,N'-diacetyllegionaminate synthase